MCRQGLFLGLKVSNNKPWQGPLCDSLSPHRFHVAKLPGLSIKICHLRSQAHPNSKPCTFPTHPLLSCEMIQPCCKEIPLWSWKAKPVSGHDRSTLLPKNVARNGRKESPLLWGKFWITSEIDVFLAISSLITIGATMPRIIVKQKKWEGGMQPLQPLEAQSDNPAGIALDATWAR